MIHRLIRGLGEHDVLTLGVLRRDIAVLWAADVEGNLEIVITGKQRQHYLDHHAEMADFEADLQGAVLDPDFVFGNLTDASMAIFYRRLNESHFLRVAVLMQASPGIRKHSIISYRLAGVREVTKHLGRCRWRRI